MSIHQLDEQTILKIAAGEVIENPASVIKELVENAIDADATQITVEIKEGGKTYMRVTDNGTGIRSDQIDLAFMRHATSKIESYDDLFRIHSMGFRGEALASIKAVSDVTVLTKTQEDSTGSYVRYCGVETKRQVVAHNTGTTILVEDLFSRLPVRAGFLKSALAEANRITDILYRFAVAHPTIGFKYVKDEKVLLHTTGSGIDNTLAEVFGSDTTEALLPVHYKDAQIEINGWVGDPSLYRGNRGMQYLFANRRIITEPQLTQLVESAYTGKIPHGRFPVFFLWVMMDPDKIDVNIHPTKSKVQWSVDTSVFLPLKQSILQSLEQATNRHMIKEAEEKKPERVNLYTMEEYTERKNKTRLAAKNVADTKIAYQPAPVPKPLKASVQKYTPEQIPLQMPEPGPSKKTERLFAGLRPIGVLHKTYLIFEDTARQEMVLLDQHAAHERILYEKLQQEFQKDQVRTQMLLVPQNLKVKPHEKTLLEEKKQVLAELGFLVEPMAEDLFVIRGIPYLIGRIQDPRNLLYALIDTMEQSVHAIAADIQERLIKKACTEAVKAGDVLSDLSVAQLLAQLEQTKQPHTCPHGRPTYIRTSVKTIEKWFRRIPS